jgi:hypothetical protein
MEDRMIDGAIILLYALSGICLWMGWRSATQNVSTNTVSDAARTLSKRAHDARRAARSKRVWAHVAALQADIARNPPQRPEQAGE